MATPIVNICGPVPKQELGSSSELRLQTRTGTDSRILHVATCRSWKELEEWIPGWNAILRENQSLSIFSTPEWLGSWWKAFGSKKEMIALAFSNEHDVLVGLAPFYLDYVSSPIFGKLAGLRLISDGSGDSDNLNLIVGRGFEDAFAKALVCWLATHRGWDLCSLNTLAENSLIANALIDELKKVCWPFISETCPNSAIPLPELWSQYVEGLCSNFRPLVTRYPARLARRYQVRIRRCEGPNELPKALEILFSLHTKRWKVANQQGTLGSPERREFYRQMSQNFLRRGWLELWVLELNGVAAAAQLCFRYGDTVYILQEGFDPKFAADKVGYALRAAMLKHFIETGARRYDFLGGLAPHKQKWGAQTGAYLNLHFARPRSRGSFCLSCKDCAVKGKKWLRRNLPAQAWSALHWLNIKLHGQPEDSATV